MPIKTQIWTVNGQPYQLKECTLPSEQLLEDMIVTAPRVLSDEWMLIGRQEKGDGLTCWRSRRMPHWH